MSSTSGAREGVGVSHPNIAFVKYWGKKDEGENVPLNGSISHTLNMLHTRTVIRHSHAAGHDVIRYGEGELQRADSKAEKVIAHFRGLTGDRAPFLICTESNFPPSCGLASSASGISALVLALDDFYGTNLPAEELSRVSRQGSGSAARSIHKGIVQMRDTHGEFLCEWPGLKIFAVLVSGEKKRVGSTEGMKRTAETSSLFRQRQEGVGKRLCRMEAYILQRDFEAFALLTMQDSNEMHACCMDSFPPIFYLNEQSRRVIEDVHALNKDQVRAAYTFDAGPNAFIITREPAYPQVRRHFEEKGYDILDAL